MLFNLIKLLCFITITYSVSAIGSKKVIPNNNSTLNNSFLNNTYIYADSGQLYFQVSIQERRFLTSVGVHICGGAIIRKDLVVTAAECLFHYSFTDDEITDKTYLNKFAVLAGINDTSKFPSSAQIVGVKKVLRLSPSLNQTKAHAIAIVILSRNFTINTFVRPIPLNRLIYPTWSVVTGWRKTHFGFQRLQMSQVKIRRINKLDCIKHVDEVYKVPVKNDVVCKRPYETETPLCYGDLGTLVIQLTNNSTFSLIGINLWGKYTCTEPRMKMNFLFEATSRYTLWLEEMMQLIKVS